MTSSTHFYGYETAPKSITSSRNSSSSGLRSVLQFFFRACVRFLGEMAARKRTGAENGAAEQPHPLKSSREDTLRRKKERERRNWLHMPPLFQGRGGRRERGLPLMTGVTAASDGV